MKFPLYSSNILLTKCAILEIKVERVIKSKDYITEFHQFPDKNSEFDNVNILVDLEFAKKFIKHHGWNYPACMYNASKDVIKLLLDKDEDKDSIFQETCSGRHPLHIAIEQKAKKEVIKLLLKASDERIQRIEAQENVEEKRSIEIELKGIIMRKTKYNFWKLV